MENIMISVPKKVMVIVAHQDDETIGCGATIKKWSDKGSYIKVVFVTDGSTGIDQSKKYEKEIINYRNREVDVVSSILSFSYDFMNYECQNILDTKLLFHSIISVIRNYKPEIVLTHSLQDKHRDHRIIHNVVKEAAWKSNENILPELGKCHCVKDVWSIEITDLHPSVDFVVDISEYMEFKLKALDVYCSQNKILGDINSFVGGLGTVRGYAINAKYGEAFKRMSYLPISL